MVTLDIYICESQFSNSRPLFSLFCIPPKILITTAATPPPTTAITGAAQLTQSHSVVSALHFTSPRHASSLPTAQPRPPTPAITTATATAGRGPTVPALPTPTGTTDHTISPATADPPVGRTWFRGCCLGSWLLLSCLSWPPSPRRCRRRGLWGRREGGQVLLGPSTRRAPPPVPRPRETEGNAICS